MTLGAYIGLGAGFALAGAWLLVWLRECVAPWLARYLNASGQTAGKNNRPGRPKSGAARP